MHINTADSFKRILANYDSGASDKRDVEFTFELHRNAMKFHIDNRNAKPSDTDLQEAIEHIIESTGVSLTKEQLNEILDLFPSERIKLAIYGISDTEVREGMYDVACRYFAGCEVPTYGDDVDLDRFLGHLKNQASIMGYELV